MIKVAGDNPATFCLTSYYSQLVLMRQTAKLDGFAHDV